MSQRKRKFESDDAHEVESSDDDDFRPPAGDSETDDPEGANNEWEIQMIRSHYPIEAKQDEPVYYWVQWKLRRGQIEDWPNDDNWVIDTGMNCSGLLKEYWRFVEKSRKKGRKLYEQVPPKSVMNEIKKREKKVPRRTAFASKMSRKVVLADDDEDEEEIVVKKPKRSRILESDDEEEAIKIKPKSKSTPQRKKELTWQEKMNLKPDDYLLDPKDRTPVPLSDLERPAAILRDAKASTSAKKPSEPRYRHREKSEKARKHERQRQEKLEAIRRQTLENKKLGEQKKRVRVESSDSSSSDSGILPKNISKDFQLTEHYRAQPSKYPQKRWQELRGDSTPDTVGIAALKLTLEERKTKQKGQFRPKESLLEEIHPTARRPERLSPAGPSRLLPAEPSKLLPVGPSPFGLLFPERRKSPERTFPAQPAEVPPIELLSDSSTGNHEDPISLEEPQGVKNNKNLGESDSEEEEVARKRVRPVHISDDEEEDEAAESGTRREEKPAVVRRLEMKPTVQEHKPTVVVQTMVPGPAPVSSSQTGPGTDPAVDEAEQSDIKPDISKLGCFSFKVNNVEEADSDIQPCLQILAEGELVIAEKEDENEEDPPERQTEQDRRLKQTMDKMMRRFQAECFSGKYQSINRELKPIYVIHLAYLKNEKQETDYAMTVFDNGRGKQPRFVCEMVPAQVVINRNPQLIIDCEARHCEEIHRNRPGPSTLS